MAEVWSDPRSALGRSRFVAGHGTGDVHGLLDSGTAHNEMLLSMNKLVLQEDGHGSSGMREVKCPKGHAMRQDVEIILFANM